jgi:hypothetical protein
VVILRPPTGARRRRRLAAVGLGLALIGAGVAAAAIVAASSNEMDRVLGAYAGGWIAVMGGLKLLHGSRSTGRADQGRVRPRRGVGPTVDDGAA